MVGVPRSKGCVSCRKSRIKCDGVKPSCGRCFRTDRTCVYADRFTFVEQSLTVDATNGQKDRTLTIHSKRNTYLDTIQTYTENGGVFLKGNTSIYHGPASGVAYTAIDVQAYRLVRCCDDGPLGMQFALFAHWFRLLPSRLGVSAALDQAVNLVHVIHTRMLRSPCQPGWLDREVYIKALHTLQQAIVDPDQAYRFETLTAAAILHLVEEKFEFYADCAVLQHAGGISRLLQIRGPVRKPKDEFEWQVLSHLVGPVLSHSIARGTPYFLAEPEWIDFFNAWDPADERDVLLLELIKQLSHWPTLLATIRKVRAKSSSREEVDIAWLLVERARAQLVALEADLDNFIADEANAMLVAANDVESPFDRVYDFVEPHTVSLIGMHSSYIFVLDMMADFLRLFSLTWIEPSTRLRSHQRRLLRKVGRCIEYTIQRQPLLSGVSSVWLCSAYAFAETTQTRNWILRMLNEADAFMQLAQPRWTSHIINVVAQTLTGARDVLPLPQA